MKKRFPRRLTEIILLAVFLFGAAMTIRHQYDVRSSIRAYEEAAQIAGRTGQELPAEPIPDTDDVFDVPEDTLLPEPLPAELSDLANIDLAALRAVNEDVAGWIEIPGTELSYPLMQGADNQFYLTHNWKGEANGSGSVYLESTNSRDLSDFHTIAYAHRMRNDTMFGTLKYYKDPDFWQEHPSVYLVTDAGIYRYDIFSAQEAGVQGIVYRLDLEENHLENDFLQFCIEHSAIDTGILPHPGNRILTLSTCTENGHANRWVVQGYLSHIYDDETE